MTKGCYARSELCWRELHKVLLVDAVWTDKTAFKRIVYFGSREGEGPSCTGTESSFASLVWSSLGIHFLYCMLVFLFACPDQSVSNQYSIFNKFVNVYRTALSANSFCQYSSRTTSDSCFIFPWPSLRQSKDFMFQR